LNTMSAHHKAPARFAIGYHREAKSSTHRLVGEIQEYLSQNDGFTFFGAPLDDPELCKRIEEGQFDILIAIGGDGTMLRAGHLSAPEDLPILGINTGNFGFLTEVKEDHWQEAIQQVLDGSYRLEKRMMLRVEHWRGAQMLGSWDALNEVVVTRGFDVRPIHLQASVDGFNVAHFVADGLIVSTPTGSTAYALAAGGPILPPDLRNILIIPVAPHLSVDRAVILSEGASVRVTVSTKHQAVISVDGQTPMPLEEQDYILAYTGENMVSFIRFQDHGYFYRNLMMYMERNPAVG
jgi:NAD+ kinase